MPRPKFRRGEPEVGDPGDNAFLACAEEALCKAAFVNGVALETPLEVIDYTGFYKGHVVQEANLFLTTPSIYGRPCFA